MCSRIRPTAASRRTTRCCSKNWWKPASSSGASPKSSPNPPLRLFFVRLSRYKRDDAFQVATLFAHGGGKLLAFDDLAMHVHLRDLALGFCLVARVNHQVVHRQAA